MSAQREITTEQPIPEQDRIKLQENELNLNIETTEPFEESVSNDTNKEPEDYSHCPICKTALQKFLIQQNYSLVMCPKDECNYPFNQEHNIDNIAYVDEKEILEVAQQRLSLNPK